MVRFVLFGPIWSHCSRKVLFHPVWSRMVQYGFWQNMHKRRLHHLQLFPGLGKTWKTTNIILTNWLISLWEGRLWFICFKPCLILKKNVLGYQKDIQKKNILNTRSPLVRLDIMALYCTMTCNVLQRRSPFWLFRGSCGGVGGCLNGISVIGLGPGQAN